MIAVKLGNVGKLVDKLKGLRSIIAVGYRATLNVDDRTLTILEAQAFMGRNVTNLTRPQEEELLRLAVKHIEHARDAVGGWGVQGDAGARAMWLALGELFKSIMGDKIEDKRPARKRRLTAAYAAWKLKTYGPKPILVASGEMIGDVRGAMVKVERK
jgi:hypothetical protein